MVSKKKKKDKYILITEIKKITINASMEKSLKTIDIIKHK